MVKKKLLNGFTTSKLQGSTLMEVIVATVLITSAFVVSGLIIYGIYSSSNVKEKLFAEMMCDKLLEESMKDQLFINQTESFNDFLIERKFQRFGNTPDIIMILIQIRTKNGKLLTEQKALHHQPNEKF